METIVGIPAPIAFWAVPRDINVLSGDVQRGFERSPTLTGDRDVVLHVWLQWFGREYGRQ